MSLSKLSIGIGFGGRSFLSIYVYTKENLGHGHGITDASW